MELRIEIEPGSDPICGVLHAGDPVVARRFIGWMGLVELIASSIEQLDESRPDVQGPQ